MIHRSPYSGPCRKLILAVDVGTTFSGHGIVRAVGAEALKEGLEDMIEEERWTKAEFKLHFRPATSAVKDATQRIPPLPPNKTIRDVFADMLQYLYKCAHEYIQGAHLRGAELWTSLQNHTEFVLTHPNGWEGTQQAQMREAAILAGLIPNTKEGRARVHFVTEGEASLNFCVQSGLTTEAMKVRMIQAFDLVAVGEELLTRGPDSKEMVC
ncbi:hypothetical protein H0H81_006726 [Sphagnurus paluster]|uniref:Uncharacterized protein n=1 Tax=Sphagnurus paluster TaxID=117069 RepID=A0A9P7GJW6_9AGAR|nr:hypothetical protein H0H81_006726 [Sphagnurus paluster]